MKFQSLFQALGLIALLSAFSSVLVGALPIDEAGVVNVEARLVDRGESIPSLNISEQQLTPFSGGCWVPHSAGSPGSRCSLPRFHRGYE